MNLTAEQVEAIRDGEPVTLSPPDVGTECVVLRADMFARVRNLIYDDSEHSPREAYSFVDRVMAEDDADDATLADYQHYRRQP